MQFTLKQLRYFVATAEHGNLTAAAQRLHVSQPSVSSAIAHLESVFDVQLFLRHKAKGVSLTPAGRRMAAEARGLLAHAADFAEHSGVLGGSLSGDVDVGCFVTFAPFYLPKLLLSFAASQPEIHVNVEEGSLDVLQDRLATGACELALLYRLGIRDDVETEVLTRLSPYVLLARTHPLAKRKALSLRDLASEPLILLDLPHSRDYFRGMFLRSGIEPRVMHRSLSFEMVRGLVANGHGYSILNLRPHADSSYDGAPVVCRPLKDDLASLSIVLASVRGARLTRRAELFAAHCRKHFARIDKRR
ncbi:MAG: LysR family transcriptional regulator [Gammaproteobacteria bacterium]|nr:LysR family transcriptional regulator [Gammaproteobacteria bacterium]